MHKLLGLLAGAVAIAAVSLPARADVVTNLGLNPTSGAGAFSNMDPGSVILPAVPTQQGGSGLASLGGAFIDIYNFTLDQALSLTIAFATNTYAGGTPQFINNFTGAVVYEGADGQIGGGDDQVVLGPELATACQQIPSCQIFGGFANLGAGEYHLRITGNAGVDSGYGGNLSVAAVPLGPAGPFFAAGLAGLWLLNKRRKKKAALA